MPPKVPDGFQSFLFRHEDIGDHEIDGTLVMEPQSFASIAGVQHLIAGLAQGFPEKGTNLEIIIDDQNTGHGYVAPSS